MSDHLAKAVRDMAWQRAKGELLSMLEVHWGDPEEFDRTQRLIRKFIDDMDNGERQ